MWIQLERTDPKDRRSGTPTTESGAPCASAIHPCVVTGAQPFDEVVRGTLGRCAALERRRSRPMSLIYAAGSAPLPMNAALRRNRAGVQ